MTVRKTVKKQNNAIDRRKTKERTKNIEKKKREKENEREGIITR